VCLAHSTNVSSRPSSSVSSKRRSGEASPDLRELNNNSIHGVSSQDMACNMSCQNIKHVPEQLSNCSRVFNLDTQEKYVPELRYADITRPISAIFPRVDFEKVLEAEEKTDVLADGLCANALCQLSCSAHKHTVR